METLFSSLLEIRGDVGTTATAWLLEGVPVVILTTSIEGHVGTRSVVVLVPVYPLKPLAVLGHALLSRTLKLRSVLGTHPGVFGVYGSGYVRHDD